MRGENDADDSGGYWLIRAYFYTSGGASIGYIDAATGGGGTINTTWAQKGNRITSPSTAAKMQIQLYFYMASGWVAYDDVSLMKLGDPTELVVNGEFESGNWTENRVNAGTSFFRGTWGIGSG